MESPSARLTSAPHPRYPASGFPPSVPVSARSSILPGPSSDGPALLPPAIRTHSCLSRLCRAHLRFFSRRETPGAEMPRYRVSRTDIVCPGSVPVVPFSLFCGVRSQAPHGMFSGGVTSPPDTAPISRQASQTSCTQVHLNSMPCSALCLQHPCYFP